MKMKRGSMVALGYGKYFRSDSIVGFQPVEEERGPGKRTWVSIDNLPNPLIASRSEGTILRDVIAMPREITKVREQYDLLRDMLDTISSMNPMLRSIIHDQGSWDIDRLEERLRDVLREDEE